MGKAISLTTPGQVRVLAQGPDGCPQCPDCGGKLELFLVTTISGEQFEDASCPKCWWCGIIEADYVASDNTASGSQVEADLSPEETIMNDHPKFRTVTIPACEEHAGISFATVTLRWVCPICVGPRGEPSDTISWDGSRRLYCHGWTNSCGHVDKYADVRREATTLDSDGVDLHAVQAELAAWKESIVPS